MDIIDIHTHNLNNIHSGIYSHSLLDAKLPDGVRYWSASIHPWYLNHDNAQLQIDLLKESLSDERMVAIGEAGLDKLSKTPFQLQLDTFKEVADIANQYGKPLIIHAVKSSNEIIEIHNDIKPSNPWIIHGFRGRKELAQQYTRHGLYLSFGERFNVEALNVVPLERILLETDESSKSINEIIQSVSVYKAMDFNTLEGVIRDNSRKIFK